MLYFTALLAASAAYLYTNLEPRLLAQCKIIQVWITFVFLFILLVALFAAAFDFQDIINMLTSMLQAYCCFIKLPFFVWNWEFLEKRALYC